VVLYRAALGQHSAAAWPLRQATLYVVGDVPTFHLQADIYKLTRENLFDYDRRPSHASVSEAEPAHVMGTIDVP
jgi:hypothetical protein